MTRPATRFSTLLSRSLLAAGLAAALPAAAADFYTELRAYPAGAIGSVGLMFAQGARDELGVSLAYNVAERGDAGEHDDESGEGFGIGVEARRFVATSRQGWFYGARAELFQLDIDWRDPGNRTGTTEITVLQPTARLGYRFAAQGSVRIELAAGLGAEINVETDGEEVGEGAIGLAGIALHF